MGGGIGMGNTCKSMADSCQCMKKTLQYCKVISLQLIKINEKKLKKKIPCVENNLLDWLYDCETKTLLDILGIGECWKSFHKN